MAVISTERTYFNGEEYTLKINCSSKGEFSINLPPAMIERLGVHSPIKDTSLAGIRGQWNKLVSEFNESSTTRHKVIVYKFNVSATIYREGEDIDGPLLQKEDLHSADGVALDIAAGVFIREDVQAGGRTNIRYERVSCSIPDSGCLNRVDYWEAQNNDLTMIDWTPEREQFFASLITAFEDLILRFNDFLGKEGAAQLEMMIDRGLALLPSKT